MSENQEQQHKTWKMLRRAVNGIALSSLPVGTLVKDQNSTFLGAPVIWKVADINHEGYPKNSITLITDRIILTGIFDATEAYHNSTTYNPRWSQSNIRQWLNSNKPAGEWYVKQTSYDNPPTSAHTKYVTYGAMDGFLSCCSTAFQDALMPTEIMTPTPKGNGSGQDTVIDKVFLASLAEVGLSGGYIGGYTEGTLLKLFNSSNASRLAYCTQAAYDKCPSSSKDAYLPTKSSWWWTRSPDGNQGSNSSVNVGRNGERDSRVPTGDYGIRPLCNLPNTIRVSETPDENGVYTIVQFK